MGSHRPCWGDGQRQGTHIYNSPDDSKQTYSRYSPSGSRGGSSRPLLPSSASARHPPCQALSVSWKLRAHRVVRPQRFRVQKSTPDAQKPLQSPPVSLKHQQIQEIQYSNFTGEHSAAALGTTAQLQNQSSQKRQNKGKVVFEFKLRRTREATLRLLDWRKAHTPDQRCVFWEKKCSMYGGGVSGGRL